MRPFPISIQLYTVRELAAADPVGTITKIAETGYVAVETAGLYGMTAAEMRALLDNVGLLCSSAHGAMPTAENLEEIIDTAKTLGYTYHISGFGPDQFATLESTLEHAALAQQAAELLAGSGIQFGIHNHWWEFDHDFDGKCAYDVFMDAAPDVLGEIDTYWVKTGGACAASVVAQYGARAPLLHIKDGPAVKDQPMTAVGQGLLDWPKIIGAAADSTAYLVVELDSCATDMMQAVVDSYTYLVGNGLARGNQ